MLDNYDIEPIHTLITKFPDRITKTSVAGEAKIKIKPADYGDKTGSSLSGDTWEESILSINGIDLYTINDCVIHKKNQILTLDNYCINETLFHFPFHEYEGHLIKTENNLRKCVADEVINVENAYCTSGGTESNYYHWVMFYVAKISSVFMAKAHDANLSSPPTIILPYAENDNFRNLALRALKLLNYPYLLMGKNTTICAKKVFFPVNFNSMGLDPHPYMKSLFIKIRDNLIGFNYIPTRKIYINRHDALYRKVLNEPEIIDTLQHMGYESISLSDRTINEQIEIFASATHIVSPHGAGLTNILFCNSSVKILELSNSNWCYRRLSLMLGIDYGHIGMEISSDSGLAHNDKSFYMNIETLKAAIVCMEKS